MRQQVTASKTTGRYAIVKIFPFVHAVKVEVEETFVDEGQNVCTERHWRLASDKDILELSVPTMAQDSRKTTSIFNKK